MVRNIQIDWIWRSYRGRNHTGRNRLCPKSQVRLLLILGLKLFLLIFHSLFLLEFSFSLQSLLLLFFCCPEFSFLFFSSLFFINFSFVAHSVLSLSCSISFLFCKTSFLLCLLGTLQLVLKLSLICLVLSSQLRFFLLALDPFFLSTFPL